MEIRPLQTITRLGLFDCDLSPDGAAVAAVYQEEEGQHLGVWSVTGCNWLLDLALAGPYARPRFGPLGRRLAAARERERLTVWSLDEGKVLFDMERGRGDEITAHAFGPGERTVAIAQGDRVGIWGVEDGAWQATLAMPGEIHAMESSPDGRLLGVGLAAGGAVVVDLEAQDVIATLPQIAQPVSTLAFHPMQAWLLTATEPSFRMTGHRRERTAHGWAQVWNYRTGEEVVRIPCDYQAALLGKGHYLATLTDNSRSLWVWQVPEAALVAHIENVVPNVVVDERGFEGRQVTLSATPRGDLLAVSGLVRPISPVGVLRIYAFSTEAVPEPQAI